MTLATGAPEPIDAKKAPRVLHGAFFCDRPISGGLKLAFDHILAGVRGSAAGCGCRGGLRQRSGSLLQFADQALHAGGIFAAHGLAQFANFGL